MGLAVDPIVALKKIVKVNAGETIELNLIISVNEDKLLAVNKLNKYRNFENVKKAFEISKIRTEEESRYLRLRGKDIVLYQKLLSYVIKFNPMKKETLNKVSFKDYNQSELWKYGISGDFPIILVKVKEENDVYTVKEILKAYEYFITRKIQVDLVILDYENNVYERYVKNEIEREINNLGLNYLINNKIFIIDKKEIENISLFEFKSNIILDAHLGNLENIILEMEEEYLSETNKRSFIKVLEKEENFKTYNIDNMDLKYRNSYGGFENDGMSYVIFTDNKIPSVWSNILTNGRMGTIVTQNLGGYTWSKNSKLNRITRWSNDTIFDTPSESIFTKDYSENKVWRIGEGKHLTTFGFGFASYNQENEYIRQELNVFVSINDDVKINILKIKNRQCI